MKLFSFIKHNSRQILFILVLLLALYSAYLYTIVAQKNFDKSLVLLSEQFLRRHITIPITSELPLGDISDYFNNFYLYFGPLPSIILMPFVFIFGHNTPQIIIGIGSIATTFVGIYFLSKTFKFSKLDSLWLSLFFVFSTVLFSASVINITAYQVEAMEVPFVVFALLEYFSKRRPLLIGSLLALAVLTRFTMMLTIVFFLAEFLQKRLSFKHLAFIFLPVLIACLILGLYNNRRFHSFFETGYKYNITYNTYPLSLNSKHGDVSISHLPANLYSFLIMAPEPLLQDNGGFFLKFPYLKANPWGMAIWYTSPLFLLVIFAFKKGKYTLSAIVASISLALPVVLYYSIGFAQFGYRYALDFLPFLFLLLIPCLRPKLSRLAIALIIIGVVFNCIYIGGLWQIYPLFNIYK
jgi:hypothetical protein